MAYSDQTPINPYTNQKLVKTQICSIYCKSCCDSSRKSYMGSTKIGKNVFLVQKGGVSTNTVKLVGTIITGFSLIIIIVIIIMYDIRAPT